MYSFPNLEPVCSMSSSSCCFLTCIQVSQEAGQVVWYSHLSKNLPQFVVIHIVKGFDTVNKTEVDVFLKLSCLTGLKKIFSIAGLKQMCGLVKHLCVSEDAFYCFFNRTFA